MPPGVRNWVIAAATIALVMAFSIPRSVLLDSGQWTRALQQHYWFGYLELLAYLGGILAAAAIFASIGIGLARLLRTAPPALRASRFASDTLAIFGFSPLQPVFANVLLILLIPTLASLAWFPFEWLRWAFTLVIVMLFGLPLGADVASYMSERGQFGVREFRPAFAESIAEQAPALAGRLAVLVLAGPLMATAVASIGRSPGQLAPEAPRLALPVEGVFAGVGATLFGFAIWLAACRSGGRTETVTAERERLIDQQSQGTARIWPVAAWVVTGIAILFPFLLLVAASDPFMIRVDQITNPPSAEHRFGTDMLGRDVYDRLIFAWRDTKLAGLSIGIALFGIGLLWRLASRYDRSLRSVESVMALLPPAVIFFGIWGLLTGILGDSITIRPIAVASAVILIPTALPLIRIVNTRQLPAAAAALVMLGTLLTVGWSTVFGLIGLIEPPLPNFGDVLLIARQERIEAPWIATRGALVLFVAVMLPVLSLAALGKTYNIERRLIRLRG